MAPILTWEKMVLNLRNPFRLSYGVSETRQVFWIKLAGDEGWGEGAIPPYYNVDPGAMTSYWDRVARTKRKPPEELSEVAAWVGSDGPAPARAAVDLACIDRLGRKAGLPLYRFLGLPKPEPRPTSFTIAIDTPEEMARMATQIAAYPVIKVKLGSDDDMTRLQAIRDARPDARLRVDANAAWSRRKALEMISGLEKLNLEMIEQPLVLEDIEGLGWLQKQTSIPIVADESVQSEDDVRRLAGAGVAGINLKLMKLGGLLPTLKILKLAGELGLRIMLGCMIETSLGVTAMAHLGGAAEWLDLDSPLLITNDPFQGVEYDEHANLTVPDRPGIGLQH